MRGLSYTAAWLELVGLAALLGGMLTLGALVAPTVFGLLPPMSTGGEVMTALFRRFNSYYAYTCLGLIILGYFGKFLLVNPPGRLRYVEGMLLLVLAAIVLYLGAVLTPEMEHLRQLRLQDPGNHEAFERFSAGHRLSQTLYAVNLIVGLAVFYLAAMECVRAAGRSGSP